jgi:hypothetical protein
MLETKSLTDSIRDKLYTNFLNSIDQEFGAEALTPPTDPELLEGWCARVCRAIKNKVITWQQFFAMFPPDYAETLKAELLRQCEEKKTKTIQHFKKRAH